MWRPSPPGWHASFACRQAPCVNRSNRKDNTPLCSGWIPIRFTWRSRRHMCRCTKPCRAAWEVHAAPRTGGAMVELGVQPKRVKAWSGLRNIQHVAVHSQGRKAVIAAQQWGHDLDLFLSHRLDSTDERGGEVWTEPRPLDGLNSQADEVFPRWEGQDVTFASNRTGAFRVYDASSALQLLRATPREDVPAGMEEVLSVVTVGPSFTWVSGRRSHGAALSVQRWDWPQAASPMPEGWTLCVSMADETEAAGTLAVRAVDSGDLIRTLNLDADGCASLPGLPADRAWAFQWDGTSRQPPTSERGVRRPSVPRRSVGRTLHLERLQGVGPLSCCPWMPFKTFRVAKGGWQRMAKSRLRPAELRAWSSESVRIFMAGVSSVGGGTMFPEEPGHWSVVGHTDASGAQHVNDKLSLDRAERIASYLVDEMGWPRSSVEVRGAGSAEPLGEDPAQNRRVEVLWVPSMQ